MIEKRIKIKPGVGGRSKVEIDGVDVSRHLNGYALVDTVKHGPRLRLDTGLLERAEILGVTNVEVDPGTAELLKSLGWTPPEAKSE